MSFRLRIIFLAVVLLAGGALQARDFEHNVEMVTGADADIRLTVAGGQMPQAGFMPLGVRINNRSDSERTWRLELDSASNGGELSSVTTLDVPAASTREFFVFVPLLAGSVRRPGTIKVNLDGPEVKRDEFTLGLGYSWGSPYAPLAAEPGLQTRLTALLTAAQASAAASATTRAGPGFRRPTGVPMQNNISYIDPALWPADWRVWSSFACVLLNHSTWERLDSARRRALLDWVAMGGQLMRINSPTTSLERHGAGLVVTRGITALAGPGDLSEIQIPDGGRSNNVLNRLANSAFWEWFQRDWQLTGRHRWLTGYILLFGLLVGPVNLFYFAPAGRRHRLFFTVPVISSVAAVLLFVVIAFSDGFGGAGTRRAVVVLQPELNQAVLFQRQISRTGLLSGRQFALPADAIMEVEGEERQGGNQLFAREGDTASGDWFTSRATQQHSLRRLVPTRERVELVGPDGAAPVVQSTVGGTLRDFVFKDQAGKIWTASEVPPGKRTTLVEAVSIVPQAEGYLPTRGGLEAGVFYARGEAAGLMSTLPAIRWRDDRVLYTGRLGPPKEAAP